MPDRLPLSGIKVVEFAGLAPGPFAGLVLADFGADVIRIDRPNAPPSTDVLARNKRSISVSLKSDAGRNIVKKLIEQADVLIDPFRPGVLEKLQLGPKECLKSNPKLVYARLTGYKRTGKFATAAGHDINYLAITGVLSMMRPTGGTPYPPLNLLADFAGGALICVQGILLALLERAQSGRGQVVEADMVTGVRYLSTFPLLHTAQYNDAGYFARPPGQNLLDGGAPFYGVYETKDGKYVSVGCLEPNFYQTFLDILQQHSSVSADHSQATDQHDRATWPALRAYIESSFRLKSRKEWESIFDGTDACVAPVLEPHEVTDADAGSEGTPSPAPHLSRTPAKSLGGEDYSLKEAILSAGRDTASILAELGMDDSSVSALVKNGTVECNDVVRAKL